MIDIRLIPLALTWIQILDTTWKQILRRRFPKVFFLNNLHSSFPPVGILLLSKVTLITCNISLYNCPTSLILSKSLLRVSTGWQNNYWPVSHSEVGGCMDGSWVLHSASRLSLVMIPILSSPVSIHPGNVCHIVCSTVYSGQPSPQY